MSGDLPAICGNYLPPAVPAGATFGTTSPQKPLALYLCTVVHLASQCRCASVKRLGGPFWPSSSPRRPKGHHVAPGCLCPFLQLPEAWQRAVQDFWVSLKSTYLKTRNITIIETLLANTVQHKFWPIFWFSRSGHVKRVNIWGTWMWLIWLSTWLLVLTQVMVSWIAGSILTWDSGHSMGSLLGESLSLCPSPNYLTPVWVPSLSQING